MFEIAEVYNFFSLNNENNFFRHYLSHFDHALEACLFAWQVDVILFRASVVTAYFSDVFDVQVCVDEAQNEPCIT